MFLASEVKKLRTFVTIKAHASENGKGHVNENGTERGTRQRDKWLGLNSSSGTIFTDVTSTIFTDVTSIPYSRQDILSMPTTGNISYKIVFNFVINVSERFIMEIGQVYSGEQFNTFGIKPFKLLRIDLKHNGFQYQLGLNKDHVPFNPSGECAGGGLYFCSEDNLPKFLGYGETVGYFTIPSDSKVYVEHEKFKCDQMVLENVVSLEEFLKKEACLRFLSKNGHALQYINDQTPEICLAAVNQSGRALKYVKDQTPEICLAAVNQSGNALEFVKEQTPEICLAAVNQNGRALQHVKNQTPELCLVAVNQSGHALEFVKEQTLELCLASVREDGCALKYVNEQTPELCLAAVNQNGWALEFVKEQTPEICLAAVNQNGHAVRFVKEQTPEICFAAVKQNGLAVRFVKDQTPEICLQ